MSNNDVSIDGSIVAVRHKIVLIGDVNVGKTSIMYRFIEEKFKDVYDPTIGVDFYSKTINFLDKQLKLQIWDSAGQERYKSLIPSYIKGASIIFIVFDISRPETFNNVPNWINFMKDSRAADSIIVLCGNKCDIEKKVQNAEAEKLAKKENLIYFEASAKTNINIKKMFYTALANLPFFEQFEKPKEKIAEELMEENNESNCAESGLKLNQSISQRQPNANNTLNIKDKVQEINNKQEKTSQQCKC